jgi:hypothetical protein
VKTSSVGRFGWWTSRSRVSKRAGEPARAREQPDGEVGAVALEPDRVEAALGQPLGSPDRRRHPLLPRGHRVGLVQAADVRELPPELLDRRLLVELRIDRPRPPRGRIRDDRPVHRPVVDHLERFLDERQPVAAGAVLVEICEQAWLTRTGDGDVRRPLATQRKPALAVPVRHELERVVRRVLDPGALHVGVEVGDVDETSASLVRTGGHPADQRCMLELAGDADDLSGLHVGAEADCELGEPV